MYSWSMEGEGERVQHGGRLGLLPGGASGRLGGPAGAGVQCMYIRGWKWPPDGVAGREDAGDG